MLKKSFFNQEISWGLFILFIGLLGPSLLAAAEYPRKPIELVVSFPPGGSTDVTARLAVENSKEYLGQPMVVLNKPGAGGMIGQHYVAKARADGYTLVIASTGVTIILPAIEASAPYNPVKDFTHVCNLAKSTIVVLVRSDSSLDTIEKLIDYAKKNPGKLNFGAVLGSGQHLSAELLMRESGIKMTHVPFNGPAPSTMALLGGQIDLTFSTYIDSAEHIKAGKLIPLAVTAPERYFDLPQAPTFVEKGYPGIVYLLWNGIDAPAGLPKSIVDRLNEYFQKVSVSPEFQNKLKKNGLIPAYMAADEFGKLIQNEWVKYQKLCKEANIKFK